MTLSYSIARLTGGPLVIAQATMTRTPDEPFVVAEEGNRRPAFPPRIRAAQDSDVHPGRTALAMTDDMGELGMAFYVTAATQADLEDLMDEATAALRGWGAITRTENGVSRVFSDRWPSAPTWNDADSGMSRIFLARATCVVPVNPT